MELETLNREHRSLEQSHRALSDRETITQAQLKKAETALAEAEKRKRAAESDLQSVRGKQLDLDGQLADVSKEKEVSSILITPVLCANYAIGSGA